MSAPVKAAQAPTAVVVVAVSSALLEYVIGAASVLIES